MDQPSNGSGRVSGIESEIAGLRAKAEAGLAEKGTIENRIKELEQRKQSIASEAEGFAADAKDIESKAEGIIGDLHL